MNKRGDGEQFNWIFVIVSGAIILSFFMIFTFKYIDLQEKRQDIDTIRFFGETVLGTSSKLQVGSGGASVDSNQDGGLRFGYKTNLGYKCDGNESLVMVNGGKTAWYKLDDEIVFMNDEMDVNSLDLWILPWNFPFHITNFIYIADPKTNFYLVKDSSSSDFADNLEITSTFNTEIVNKNQLLPAKNSKVVFFSKNMPSTSEVINLAKNKEKIDFVYIDIEKNEAAFFDMKNRRWSNSVRFYFTEENKEQLYGAIFSNNADNFECNLRKSLNRAKAVAKIYEKRSEILLQIDKNSECHYREIANDLKRYSEGRFDLANTIENQNLAGSGCIWVF